MPLIQLTTAEVIREFGDPAEYLRADGTIGEGWERAILAVATLPEPMPLCWDLARKVDHFRCHWRLVSVFEAALLDAQHDVEAWATINDFGGCYAFRTQRRAKPLSRHSWGIAIDLDCCDNPFGRQPRVHPRLPKIFEAHGFLWGGNFRGDRKDGMHWEFADLGGLA